MTTLECTWPWPLYSDYGCLSQMASFPCPSSKPDDSSAVFLHVLEPLSDLSCPHKTPVYETGYLVLSAPTQDLTPGADIGVH